MNRPGRPFDSAGVIMLRACRTNFSTLHLGPPPHIPAAQAASCGHVVDDTLPLAWARDA